MTAWCIISSDCYLSVREMAMAADKTVVKAAHVDLSASTAYTVNLTGAGKYVDIVCHSTGSNDDVYFDIAGAEADLATVADGGDDLMMVHSDERIRIPVPRNTWIRFFSAGAKSVSVMKVTTIF